MTRRPKPQPVHDDGYSWQPGLLGQPDVHTLIAPMDEWVAHVYRANDRTWAVVWADGDLIAQGLPTAGEAMRAAEDLARRPCAHIDTHPSHGIVPCDLEREPGSRFCTAHTRALLADRAVAS